ncbi:AbrB/MazE/SpoVT family DNA-binding domain-containing protein [Streptomyces sp. NPDC047081]|uniref:AbrB/MazE/SpoVT family DNA-binding domain-containing protein n=1 Tax=Bacteria TaxID=2 RepID=UPI003402E6B4
MTKKSWTVECLDAGDGSGDVIVELPQDFLDEMNLKTGDTLDFAIDEAGIIIMTKKPEPDPK